MGESKWILILFIFAADIYDYTTKYKKVSLWDTGEKMGLLTPKKKNERR